MLTQETLKIALTYLWNSSGIIVQSKKENFKSTSKITGAAALCVPFPDEVLALNRYSSISEDLNLRAIYLLHPRTLIGGILFPYRRTKGGMVHRAPKEKRFYLADLVENARE